MFQRYFKESSCFLKWVECSSVFDSLLQKGYNVCLGNFKSGSGKFQGCFKSESRVIQNVTIAFQASFNEVIREYKECLKDFF